jgi:c-di-AMP phosphodiesterase-like protein
LDTNFILITCFHKSWIFYFYVMFVTSNHQTTNFFHKFFSVLAVEKEKKLFYWSKKSFFSQFWTNKKIVFCFNCSNWEKFVKKLGKTRLVVWWFDVTNKKKDSPTFSNVLGSTSIWTSRISNICYCFLQASAVEKLKTNIRKIRFSTKITDLLASY